MTTTIQLSELRTAAQRQADMENSSFVSDAEWNQYINDANSEMFDIFVTQYEDYAISTTTINVVANTESYALPSDFYKLRGAFVKNGNTRIRLEKFNLDEIADWTNESVQEPYWGTALRYRILGSNIYFSPMPQGAQTVELFYVPEVTKLSSDTDTLEYPTVNGWEQFIILGAAIRARIKEESNVQELMILQQQTKNRIMEAASSRDAHRPQKVRDVFATGWGRF